MVAGRPPARARRILLAVLAHRVDVETGTLGGRGLLDRLIQPCARIRRGPIAWQFAEVIGPVPWLILQ